MPTKGGVFFAPGAAKLCGIHYFRIYGLYTGSKANQTRPRKRNPLRSPSTKAHCWLWTRLSHESPEAGKCLYPLAPLFILNSGHPLWTGEGWRQMVRDGPVLEGVRRVMCEPHFTPELFKVRGTELPPPQSPRQRRSSAGHRAQLGTGSFGNKSYFQWYHFHVSFVDGAIALLWLGRAKVGALSAGYGAVAHKHTCAFGTQPGQPPVPGAAPGAPRVLPKGCFMSRRVPRVSQARIWEVWEVLRCRAMVS